MGEKKEEQAWTKVDSSNLNMVRYDPTTKLLEIWFHNGSIYSYTPITKDGYYEFLNADSVGKYFNKNIRGNDSITSEQLVNKVIDG